MKKSSLLVIIIPLLIAGVVVGSVFVVRYFSPVPEESQAAPNPVPSVFPAILDSTGKPEVGFDGLQPVSPVSDLRLELEEASDSSGQDIERLEQEAASF
jgi:flagellar basal body-associated protein FliL